MYGEAFNIGSKKPNETREIVQTIIEVSEKDYNKLLIVSRGQPFEKVEQYSDITKAKESLDWEPEIELKEGLRETFKWYQKQRERT